MKFIALQRTFITTIILCLVCFSACSSDEYTGEKYKRIFVDGLPSEEAYQILKDAEVEDKTNEDFGDTIPLYRIVPKAISEDDFKSFLTSMGHGTEQVNTTNENGVEEYKCHINTDKISLLAYFTYEESKRSYLSYSYNYVGEVDKPLDATDEEIEAVAKSAFEKLSFLDGEYVYSGIGSVQTVSGTKGSFVVRKRAIFARVVDGVKMVNGAVSIYIDAYGVSGINAFVYDYEKIGDFEMMSTEDAIAKVKAPDGFQIDDEDGKELLSNIDRMVLEEVRLRYVNLFNEGCTVLQPAYNIVGTLYSGEDSVGFSSKIIAIPEKYTYVSDSTEQG